MSKSSNINIEKLSETIETLSNSLDLYILFIDLCDSTEIKQYCLDNSLPDIFWISRQMIFLSRTSKIIKNYKGTLVKTIGDEVMATFSIDNNPDKIVNCCVEVFQTFQNLKSYNKGKFIINCKASIDFGTCFNGQILNSEIIDPIGNCVDRCARISKEAKYNQIVCSEEFFTILNEKKVNISKYNITKSSKTLKGLGIMNFATLEL